MMLRLDSPRFSLRTADFSEIAAAIDETGHVVLDDVWNRKFLSEILGTIKNKFAADDAKFSAGFERFHPHATGIYLAGVTELLALFDGAPDGAAKAQELDQRFFSEIERAGLTALLRHLSSGDFVIARSDRVVRRTDPRMAVRFTGLHHDHQLEPCVRRSKQGFAVTMWSPLQDCIDDDIPRLLLLKRGQSVPEESPEVTRLGGIDRINNTMDTTAIEEGYTALYASRECYAPQVRFGSMVMFDYRTIHGSFRRAEMTKTRYSIDCRAVSKYLTAPSTWGTSGVLYRSGGYPAKAYRAAERATAAVRLLKTALKDKHARARLFHRLGVSP